MGIQVLQTTILNMIKLKHSAHPAPFQTFSGANFIKCLSLNAHSIVNKLPEWYHLLYGCDNDIIFVTETWLHGEIPSSLLDPDGRFDVIRCDRL